MTQPQAAIGPAMTDEQEAEHRQRLAETDAAEAEKAVAIIEAKLAGMKESLTTAKANAKRLRAAAEKGRG